MSELSGGTVQPPWWQKCPRCDGQGHTAKPPWVPGDVHTWMSTNTQSHVCPPCGGLGMILMGTTQSGRTP